MDDHDRLSVGIEQKPDDAIEELNVRFRDHAIGYRFADGYIVRADSEYVHAEVVQPTLALLREAIFRVAQEEFLTAHKHYRQGREKECIVACQRAFESLLKAMCTARKWDFGQGSGASELIKLVRQRGLFPDYLDAGFDTFVAMLKTGLPGVRNNAGAHGAAPDAPAVPSYIAGYALHMTATNILLLAESFRSISC
ncbi:MAG: HEPN domain-containing protein [Proteobacteria bacterium]|nr:HEPN domain-containing protein [Pseudomonadota bacterium]